MTKKLWILSFALPVVRGLITLLRHKDDNETGLDDAAADAGERFLEELERYLAS